MMQRQSKTKRKGGKKSRALGVNTEKTVMMVVPKLLGWAPPRLRTNLRFSKFFTISAAAASAANVRFVPTFLFDVDPIVGSTSVPGFTEWGGIYRFYRVNSAAIRCSFANAQAFNVVCYVCPVNFDPGANYSGTAAQTYLSNRLSQSQVAGPLTGNGQVELSHRVTTAGFGGAANLLTTDSYSAGVSGGAPGNNYYFTVGIVGTGTVSTGVDVEVFLDIEADFFELQSPAA
jgi:hypothetical protein